MRLPGQSGSVISAAACMRWIFSLLHRIYRREYAEVFGRAGAWCRRRRNMAWMTIARAG